jgi:hypothetical protein
MNVVLTYKTLVSAPHTVTLTVNDAVIGTFSITTGSAGSIRMSNALSATLNKGGNAVALVRDAANSDFEIQLLSFNP